MGSAIRSAYTLLLTQHIGEATQAGQEVLAIFEELDNPFGIRVAAGLILGILAMATGEIGAAKAYFTRGEQVAAAITYLRLLQITNDSLGTLALGGDDTEQERQYFLRSLRISQGCGQPREMLASLRDLAIVSRAQGDLEQALVLLAVVLNHPASEQTSLNRPERLRDEADRLRVDIEAHLEHARYQAAWDSGQRWRLAEVVAQVLQ